MEQNQNMVGDLGLGDYIRELGQMLADVRALEAGARVPQLIPAEAVYRDPKDAYHQITIGAVLAAYHLSAHDARRLDGLLSLSPKELASDRSFGHDWRQALARSATLGEALVAFLNKAGPKLEDLGRYAEWRRRYDNYMDRSERFLSALDKDKLKALVYRPASRKQVWLVRYTCEAFGLPFPELPNRKAAYVWLRHAGANPRYKQVQP